MLIDNLVWLVFTADSEGEYLQRVCSSKAVALAWIQNNRIKYLGVTWYVKGWEVDGERCP